MLQDIINAEYIEGYKIKVEFENDYSGIVDFSDYTKRSGIFEKFLRFKFFQKFYCFQRIGYYCMGL